MGMDVYESRRYDRARDIHGALGVVGFSRRGDRNNLCAVDQDVAMAQFTLRRIKYLATVQKECHCYSPDPLRPDPRAAGRNSMGDPSVSPAK